MSVGENAGSDNSQSRWTEHVILRTDRLWVLGEVHLTISKETIVCEMQVVDLTPVRTCSPETQPLTQLYMIPLVSQTS
jgi:hypothetical protein